MRQSFTHTHTSPPFLSPTHAVLSSTHPPRASNPLKTSIPTHHHHHQRARITRRRRRLARARTARLMAFSGRAKFPPPYLDIATDRRDAHTSRARDDRASTKAACDPEGWDAEKVRSARASERFIELDARACVVCLRSRYRDVYMRSGLRTRGRAGFFFIQSWTLGSRSSSM